MYYNYIDKFIFVRNIRGDKMATNSEERLVNYKEKIYDFLNEVVNGKISGSKIRRELESYKKNITQTLSFASDAERKNLEAICQKELDFINTALSSKAIGDYITNENVELLKNSNLSHDEQTSDKEEQDNNISDNKEPKEDLNKIHVKRVNEIERMLKDLNLSYEYFIKDRDDIEDLNQQKNILNKYLNEFNAINKELSKITNKTVKNTKNTLPNVKNEDDRKRWEQENRELLNRINSLIPDVQNPLLSLKKEIGNIEESIKHMEENQKVIIDEPETVEENEQDNNVVSSEETANDNKDVMTEDEYYADLAKNYIEEELENENIPYESLLNEEDLKLEEAKGQKAEETLETEDDGNLTNIEGSGVAEDEQIEIEEETAIDADIEKTKIISQSEDKIEKRIKRYVDFSKLKTKQDLEDRMDKMYDYIVENIEDNPKKYREIRKVFKRIFYDEVEFNGDTFMASIFDGGMPQYLGGKLTHEDSKKLKKGIELYKKVSTTGKIPKEEIDTFDKFVLAPYELRNKLIERHKEKSREEENDMMEDLRSQIVNHEEIIQGDSELIDEDDFEIVDDIELEEDNFKR